MLFDTLSIVGVGLLGGSLGLAAKKRGVVRHIIGVGRDAARLREAQSLGLIDTFETEIAAGVKTADLVVLCTPVDRIPQHFREVADAAKPGCIITDVGSTKSQIVREITASNPGHVEFIGSHPMAGSEKKGASHAREDLFENRVTIVTPVRGSVLGALGRVRRFWQHVGCRVLEMTPEEHDRAVAYVSHLPHVVATALAGVVDPAMLGVSAGGFRDTTRIASATPTIWEPIFRTNKEEVLAACSAFQKQLAEFQQLLEADDTSGLIRWLHEGKKVRDALGS